MYADILNWVVRNQIYKQYFEKYRYIFLFNAVRSRKQKLVGGSGVFDAFDDHKS